METTKLSSKGQIVLPKAVGDAGEWPAGTEFEVREVPDGVLLRALRTIPGTQLEEVFGCLRYTGKPKTVSEMKRGVAREVKKRSDRGRY